MAKISVVMPVFNSERYLEEAIDSIRKQTFDDWEMLVINEFGSNDRSSEIIKKYADIDHRIKLIQNTKKIGIAESLNLGIRLASGEYIARIDADDLAETDRFQKQVDLLDSFPEVVICGGWQLHFGKNVWIHTTQSDPEQCKANLLFYCDLCHSTLMIRKKTILEHKLFYDKKYFAEDFELWTRFVQYGKITNIPEVLGKYREGEDNITNSKKEALDKESGQIVANNLKRNLKIDLPKDAIRYFNGWVNPFDREHGVKRDSDLLEFEKILRNIYERNLIIKYYDSPSLLSAIASKWYWGKYNFSFNKHYHFNYIDDVFIDKNMMVKLMLCKKTIKMGLCKISGSIKQIMVSTKRIVKKIIFPVYLPTVTRLDILADRVINHNEMAEKFIKAQDSNLKDMEKNITQTQDSRIWQAEKNIISQNEYLINKVTDFIKITRLEKNQPKIILFGTPYHSNLGDHIQTFCIKEWCKKNYPNYMVFEIKSAADENENFFPLLLELKEKITKNDRLFVHSGSHLTDLFFNEQVLTLAVLQVFYDYPIIIFPQTIYFQNIERLQKVADIYGTHSKLLLLTREQKSTELAKKYLANVHSFAFPDIANTLIGQYRYEGKREGILLCLRNDCESLFPEDKVHSLVEELNKFASVSRMDTEIDATCDQIAANREFYINSLIEKFSKYRIVISDRMHGTIFSLIANTPVIVLPALEDKVKSNLEWYSETSEFNDYVYFCNTLEEVVDKTKKILNLELNYHLPPYFLENYYLQLKSKIEDAIF